jgi:hypothetical protein
MSKKFASKGQIKEQLQDAVEKVAEKLEATNIQADELPELSAKFTIALTSTIEAASDKRFTFTELMDVGAKWRAFGAAWKAARQD